MVVGGGVAVGVAGAGVVAGAVVVLSLRGFFLREPSLVSAAVASAIAAATAFAATFAAAAVFAQLTVGGALQLGHVQRVLRVAVPATMWRFQGT